MEEHQWQCPCLFPLPFVYKKKKVNILLLYETKYYQATHLLWYWWPTFLLQFWVRYCYCFTVTHEWAHRPSLFLCHSEWVTKEPKFKCCASSHATQHLFLFVVLSLPLLSINNQLHSCLLLIIIIIFSIFYSFLLHNKYIYAN